MFEVANKGEPIKLKDVRILGIAASTALQGETASIWDKISLTSDSPIFHSAVPGFCESLRELAAAAGSSINAHQANSVMLVIHSDNTGDLWIDSVATTVAATVKRALDAGSAVFVNDIANIVAVGFPAVKFSSSDRVLYLFRSSWRFGLYYDLRRDRALDVPLMEREIGAIHRNLAFRHLYAAAGDPQTMSALQKAGWFPFIDFIGDYFDVLVHAYRQPRMIEATEKMISDAYGEQRLDGILERWLAHPVMAKKRLLLTSAINSFKAEDYVAPVKILLTEIESIINHAYRMIHGRGANLRTLLDFLANMGTLKGGARGSMLLPDEFGRYLKDYTFAQSDSREPEGPAGSRHSVGHGTAGDDAYTRIRALQAILTLDQLAFYL